MDLREANADLNTDLGLFGFFCDGAATFFGVGVLS